MKYVLITEDGRFMTFYLKSIAEIYQKIYGGVVFLTQPDEKTLPEQRNPFKL